MFALTTMFELYGTKLLVPAGAPGGRVPVAPAIGTGRVAIRSPLDALIIAGERLPPPVYGLMSYCQSLDEFHSLKYQFGFAVVPRFVMTYLICSPLGPATVVPVGTPVTLKRARPVYASKARAKLASEQVLVQRCRVGQGPKGCRCRRMIVAALRLKTKGFVLFEG